MTYVGYSFGAGNASTFISTGPTQKQLEAMGHLAVLMISLADILEGRSHGYEGTWLVKGDAVYTVDIRNMELKDKNIESNTTVPVLPQPEISLHHRCRGSMSAA